MFKTIVDRITVITGFDKVLNLRKIVIENGGAWNSLKKLYYQDDLKTGTLIGTDDFGNKYFENPYYFVPRNRWVEYNPKRGLDYNASQIPPEWHRWLQHIAENPPTIEKPVRYPWMLRHEENKTGTADAYTPYNTVQPKIQEWVPNKSQRISRNLIK